jgi:asparagine N-glycosylation enzyme membrane subunit Stt3
MVIVNPQRLVAVVLFLVAFLTLAASRAFPFLDDVPGVVQTAVVVVGVACGLGGAYLWVARKTGPKA